MDLIDMEKVLPSHYIVTEAKPPAMDGCIPFHSSQIGFSASVHFKPKLTTIFVI
jgi:hypothetical protein